MSREELLTKYQPERTRCTNWTRVMGYIRNRDSFNDGKKSEWTERVFFNEKVALANEKMK